MSLPNPSASRFPRPDQIPAEVDPGPPLIQTEYLQDGELREWRGPLKEVFSPVHQQGGSGLAPRLLGSFPHQGEAEALAALAAARSAWDNGRGRWPTIPVSERIRNVEEFTLRMVERRGEIVRMLMWEVGKTRPDSEKEFDRTVQYIRDTVDALKELDRTSSRFSVEEGILGQIRRGPLGVVLSMGPFNYPLNETFTTLIPALIMGNTVIVKPPRHGALLWSYLQGPFRDSFPRGVVNFVYGEGRQVAGPLMASGGIDVLAFIGSSRAADALKHQHPRPHRLRSVLGLDAKNPAVILPDADLDLAVQECVAGALSFNGQRCTALKILFVQRALAEPFMSRFATAVSNLGCGMPWQQGVSITPLPEPGKPAFLAELVQDALQAGGRVVNKGGGEIEASFFTPAVVGDVHPQMRLWREEQFGPVIPIALFDDIEQPISYIVESNFGQQASLFGRSPEAIARLIDPLVNQVCRLNLNSQCQRGPDTFPFTGRKDSAEGTLSVSDALRVFSIRTLVAAKANEGNKALITRILRDRRSNFLSTDFLF